MNLVDVYREKTHRHITDILNHIKKPVVDELPDNIWINGRIPPGQHSIIVLNENIFARSVGYEFCGPI